MDIVGFMIVKDEVDILTQTLRFLEQFGGFSKIFVFPELLKSKSYDSR